MDMQTVYVTNKNDDAALVLRSNPDGGTPWLIDMSALDTLFTHAQYDFLRSLESFEIPLALWTDRCDYDSTWFRRVYKYVKGHQSTAAAAADEMVTLLVHKDGNIWRFKAENALMSWSIRDETSAAPLPSSITIPVWLWNAREKLSQSSSFSTEQRTFLAVLRVYLKTKIREAPKAVWGLEYEGRRLYFTPANDRQRVYARASRNKQDRLFAYFIEHQPQPADDDQASEWIEWVDSENLHTLWYDLTQA